MTAAPCLTERAAAIITEAESWIGTPYRHQGTQKHVGCDCLGLVRGIWRAVIGREPEAVPPYARDWALADGWTRGPGRLAEAACRHLGPPISRADMVPGDLLLFALVDGGPACHCAILAGPDTIIHAWEKAGVVASPFHLAWRRRLAAVHRFPED